MEYQNELGKLGQQVTTAEDIAMRSVSDLAAYIVNGHCHSDSPMNIQYQDRQKVADVISKFIEHHAAQPGAKDAWRPIETAPKGDGAEYLVHNDRGTFAVWYDPTWGSDGKGWWMVSDGKDFERALRGSTPTHWMPLPAAPANDNGEKPA